MLTCVGYILVICICRLVKALEKSELTLGLFLGWEEKGADMMGNIFIQGADNGTGRV